MLTARNLAPWVFLTAYIGVPQEPVQNYGVGLRKRL